MIFNKNYFEKIIKHKLQNNNQNIKIIFKYTQDLTQLLEKLIINKVIKLNIKKFHFIKIQENIFYKQIFFLNTLHMYNIYINKYNTLINLHKYLSNTFPVFIFNINTTNNIFFQELNTQLNFLKNIKINQSPKSPIINYPILNSLKSIEYIFELYSHKYSTNLINPTTSFILNLNIFTKHLYYIEIPLQNLLSNLNITTLSNTSKYTITYFKTIGALVLGGEILNINTFSPNLIITSYYNTIISNTYLYIALKNTSIYAYNLILESLLKQYQYQGIILPSILFELIIKRMISYVKISNSGDTCLVYKDIISSTLVNIINQSFILSGLIGSFYSPIILGISKISLGQSGLLSSISFQETLKSLSTLVLTNQIDWILDLKAKIIMSDLLDTGTGWYKHYNIITKNF